MPDETTQELTQGPTTEQPTSEAPAEVATAETESSPATIADQDGPESPAE